MSDKESEDDKANVLDAKSLKGFADSFTYIRDQLLAQAKEIDDLQLGIIEVSNFRTAKRGLRYLAKLIGSIEESIALELYNRHKITQKVAEAAREFETKKRSSKNSRGP